MAALAIRLARDTDARPIAVMSRCLIELGLRGWSWDPARVTRAIRSSETCVIVSQSAHRISGFAVAEFGDARLHLSLLAVAAEQRRQGIGHALMQWMETSAVTAGITEIQLELRANNSGAKYFYQALGYQYVHAIPGYYRGEETALKMRKELNAHTASQFNS